MIKKLFSLFTLILLAIPLAWGAKYVKVTSGTLESGRYLIVCEESNVAFNGSLTTLDAEGNTISVTIDNGEIAVNSSTEGAYFDIAVNGDSYTIQSASQYYIGTTGTGNGLNAATTYNANNHKNTITINEGNADIVAVRGPHLRYNANSGQTRFRYFKAETYTSQQPIQLYKLDESTPTPSGPSYYLVGNFNEWSEGDDDTYKFSKNNGTYTLNNVSISENYPEFKIKKVDENAVTIYGGEGGTPYVLHHRHHTGINMKNGGNEGSGCQVFKMQSAGVTSLSFQVENDVPGNLCVNRDPALAIKGDFTNNWQEVAMTPTADGWATTQDVSANNEFGFVDEFGQYIGIKWTVYANHLGTNLPMTTDGGQEAGNYKMGIAGKYKFTANSELSTLVIKEVSTSDIFELVKDATSLNEDDEYIIVSKDDSYAMGYQKKDNRHAVAISFTDDGRTKTDATDDTEIFSLEESGTGWYLKATKINPGYLYAASSSNNHLKTENTIDNNNNAFATISIDSQTGVASIVFSESTNRNVMQYNSSSTLFSCYSSASQSAVYLYKRVANKSKAPIITPNPAPNNGINIVGYSTELTMTQANSGTIYYTMAVGDQPNVEPDDPADPTTSSLVYNPENKPWAEVASLGCIVKIKAVAKEGDKELSNASFAEFKFVAPATPVFNPGGGTYTEPQNVTFENVTTGADVYYTTDADSPVANFATEWTKYTGQFIVSEPATYYAVAVYPDAHYPNKYAITNKNNAKATYNFNYTATLADIEASGVKDATYTVNEPLQVVYFDSTKDFAIARDLTGTTVTPNGVDYMTTVVKEHTGEWKQYNWVMLDLSGVENLPENLVNGIIPEGSLKGLYTDNNNYTIKVETANLSVTTGTAYEPYVYCPANFQVDANGCQTGYKVEWVERKDEHGNTMHDQNGNTLYDMEVGETPNAVTYWFMTPKPMEVFELSGALWCGDGFYMEQRKYVPATETEPILPEKWYNPAGLKGGISLNTSCNSTDEQDLDLQTGQSYRFLSVAWRKVSKSEPSYGEPVRLSLEPESGSTLNTTFQAGALNLTGSDDQIVTGVSEVKTGGEVVSVTYCDLAGRMSQKPFAGVNIIVTRYSDGTVKTTKAIK